MRNDHSIAGTTILQTTLEDADNKQFFIDGKTNPVVKVGRWTLRRFGVQHHRQSVARKGKVGLILEIFNLRKVGLINLSAFIPYSFFSGFAGKCQRSGRDHRY